MQNAFATRDGVLDRLDCVLRETTARDVAMVFLAGHGMNDTTASISFRRTTPISTGWRVGHTADRYPASPHASRWQGACHGGQIMASRRALLPDVSRFVETVASAENGVVVFSASTGGRFAIEDAIWGNGSFTKALLEGLAGCAEYLRDKVIIINELDIYLSERVTELTGGRQSLTTAKPPSTQGFQIAVVR